VGKKSSLTAEQKRDVVLMLLRREEQAAAVHLRQTACRGYSSGTAGPSEAALGYGADGAQRTSRSWSSRGVMRDCSSTVPHVADHLFERRPIGRAFGRLVLLAGPTDGGVESGPLL